MELEQREHLAAQFGSTHFSMDSTLDQISRFMTGRQNDLQCQPLPRTILGDKEAVTKLQQRQGNPAATLHSSIFGRRLNEAPAPVGLMRCKVRPISFGTREGTAKSLSDGRKPTSALGCGKNEAGSACMISAQGADGLGHQLEAKLSCIGVAAAFNLSYVHQPIAQVSGLLVHAFAYPTF